MRNTMKNVFPVGKIKKKKRRTLSVVDFPATSMCLSCSDSINSILSNYYGLQGILANTKKNCKTDQWKREPNEEGNPRQKPEKNQRSELWHQKEIINKKKEYLVSSSNRVQGEIRLNTEN